jgi:hypothetical protein
LLQSPGEDVAKSRLSRRLPPAGIYQKLCFCLRRFSSQRRAPPLRGALVAGVVIARAMGTLVYASVCHFEPPVDAKTK